MGTDGTRTTDNMLKWEDVAFDDETFVGDVGDLVAKEHAECIVTRVSGIAGVHAPPIAQEPCFRILASRELAVYQLSKRIKKKSWLRPLMQKAFSN